MAKKTQTSSKELAQARHLRKQCTTAAELRKALSVLLIAELGIDAEKAADLLGISERTIFRNRSSFRNQGCIPRNTWGGRRRCCLTIEQEREFLAQWESAATAGGVLTVPPIHAALVKRLGRDIPISTTYRLLARHGWRKVKPDTKHPQSDPVVQEEFKKNSPKLWKPPA